ncbi:MAG: polyprenyl synthetase family protein [Pseudomonadota bacterium]
MAETIAGWGTLPVVEGMRYAVEGGKGLRGYLALESARLHGFGPDQARFSAAAIEALHAYSLVHDDLPAMDDDDLRRGRPTVHKKWDEATGVLVGDALLTLAFELAAMGEAERRLVLVSSLARAAGAQGMVLGQAQDMAAQSAGEPLTLEEISDLQRLKTGALIEWSACVGPRLAGADETPLLAYAQALGLAFQITDDILDVEGDETAVGKALRKDDAAGKATFVSLLGLDGAKVRAAALVEEACDALLPYGAEAASLKEAARFVVERSS